MGNRRDKSKRSSFERARLIESINRVPENKLYYIQIMVDSVLDLDRKSEPGLRVVKKTNRRQEDGESGYR
jgi:hypothetical protein